MARLLTVRLTKRFPDGQLAKLKKFTLAPDGWSDEKLLAVTQQVGDTPPVATRARDGATLHRQLVDAIEWEVRFVSHVNVVCLKTGAASRQSPYGRVHINTTHLP